MSDGGEDWSALVRPDGRVHRRLYTDPAIFEAEMSRIFGASWVFLAHEGEIRAPHDFKATTLGRRPVLVTRDGKGDIHALLNRCTHRGSLVCVEPEGNARIFRCPYHFWNFASDGRLVSLPAPEGYGPGFDPAAQKLRALPRVESYRGYIFGSLNPAVEPLTQWLGAARSVLDWAIDQEWPGPVRVAKGVHHSFRGNWKHANDNNCDTYHVPFLHLSTAQMNEVRHGSGRGLDHVKTADAAMYMEDLGNGHKLVDQRPSLGSGWRRARPVPGRENLADAIVAGTGAAAERWLELSGRAGINLILYPNLFVMGNGSFAVYEPVAVNRTNIRYYTVLLDDAPPEVNLLRLRFTEDFNNVGQPDDNEAMERVQQALETIPEVEWLNFGRGLGTDRETTTAEGTIRGHIMDETSLRGSYRRWQELMSRNVELTTV